jgi:hypothetical protein
MTNPDEQPKVEAKPVPAVAPKNPPIPPKKGWRNFGGQDQQKFKPIRSGAVRFIQARRAPGK